MCMALSRERPVISSLFVGDWVGKARFDKAFAPQLAGITPAAGHALRIRIVTRMGQSVIHPQFYSAADDLRLGELDERRMDAESARSLDACFSRQLAQLFKGRDELWPTIGIARVIERVDSDKDVAGAQHLGISQGQCEKYRVARGDVGDRD